MSEPNPQGDPATTEDPATATAPTGDEPLGEGGKKALDAEREARKAADRRVAELTAELEKATAGATPTPDVEGSEEEPEWKQKFDELHSNLETERDARQKAEEAAQKAELAALRIARAYEKQLPAPLAKKLSGTTAEEIDAEIDELLPYIGTGLGPQPNPQQGNPSRGRGGSIAAGRERYAQTHK